MTTKERKELHLMFGLCTYPISGGCCNLINHRRSKYFCTYHLDKPLLRKKMRYEGKKERGECKDCTEPVKPGYVRCEEHLLKDNKQTLEQKHRRKREGRCYICGGPLHNTGTTCANCIDYNIERNTFL